MKYTIVHVNQRNKKYDELYRTVKWKVYDSIEESKSERIG